MSNAFLLYKSRVYVPDIYQREAQARAYHGTPGGFEVLEHDRSGLGTHFGTKESASTQGRGLGMTGPDPTFNNPTGQWEVRGYDLDVRNPLRLNDINSWNRVENVVSELYDWTRPRILEPQERNEALRLAKADPGAAWSLVRGAIERAGYDSVVYANKHEDVGNDSYIVWDNAKIKRVGYGSGGLALDIENGAPGPSPGTNLPLEVRGPLSGGDWDGQPSHLTLDHNLDMPYHEGSAGELPVPDMVDRMAGRSIVVTIPKNRVREVEAEEAGNTQGLGYYWQMGRLPKEQPSRIYFAWDGAVRAYHEVTGMDRDAGQILMDPTIHDIDPVPMGGFRGFRYYAAAAYEGLANLLAPPGQTGTIGQERGRVVPDGISVLHSAEGSNRYVYSVGGKIVAALQVMSREPGEAFAAQAYTAPEYRRQGLAKQLGERARADFAVIHPSNDVSDAGAAFQESWLGKHEAERGNDLQMLDQGVPSGPLTDSDDWAEGSSGGDANQFDDGGGTQLHLGQAQRQPWVAVDLDGTVLEHESGMAARGEFGEVKPGAAEALGELEGLGWRITIFTARLADLDETAAATAARQIASYLAQKNVPFTDVWVGRKPRADYFVDDKAIHFGGDWQDVLLQLVQEQPSDVTLDSNGLPPGTTDELGVAAGNGLIDTQDGPNDFGDFDYTTRRDRSFQHQPELEEVIY